MYIYIYTHIIVYIYIYIYTYIHIHTHIYEAVQRGNLAIELKFFTYNGGNICDGEPPSTTAPAKDRRCVL